MKNCLILHGPNLNLLGSRETHLYGTLTLSDINSLLVEKGKTLGINVSSKHSNHEGELISFIQQAGEKMDGLIINAAGYSHSSVALRDSLTAFPLPFVEIHMTNILKREPFRHRSLIGDLAVGTIIGFGWKSYLYGLVALSDFWRKEENAKN